MIKEVKLLQCIHCSEEGTSENFELDVAHERGFWCESCDGFTYYNKSRLSTDRYTLLLEVDKGEEIQRPVVPVKLKKQLSPLRYPGGKSKVIDYLYTHLNEKKSKILVSPFTGGGSFELSMLESGVVDHLHLNDLDFGIYSLWWVILHAPYELTDLLLTREKPTRDDFFKARTSIQSDFHGKTMIEAAWETLLVNRLAFSGIAKAHPMGGKNGSQEKMLIRWNPNTLIKRIQHIHSFADRIKVTQKDAIELIEESYWEYNSTIFIDPPYLEKGADLYNCYYKKEDHIELATLLDTLYRGVPGADILVTYDYDKWLDKLYECPKVVKVGRRYSI